MKHFSKGAAKAPSPEEPVPPAEERDEALHAKLDAILSSLSVSAAPAAEAKMTAYAADGSASYGICELPIPTADGFSVVVKNTAISYNPVDMKRLKTAEKGTVLGWDSVGIVTAAGQKCSRISVGDRVWYAGDVTKPGTNAQYTKVDERIVSLAPTAASDAEAAAIPLVGLTAFEGLTEKLGLASPSSIGKSILVLPGAGGTGAVTIQLAKKMLQMLVVATSSREETTNYCKELGADHVINHKEPLKPQLEALGLSGVDYVFNAFDTAANFEQYCEIVKPMGGIVSIVETGGVALDIGKLMRKRISFHWEFMFQRSMNGEDGDLIQQGTILKKLAYLVDSGLLRSPLTKTLSVSVDGLLEANKLQLSGTAIGKTVLLWPKEVS